MTWQDKVPPMVQGRGVPLHWDEGKDDWDAPRGDNGSSRVVLYGPSGQPISTVEGKLAVRAAELETILSSQSTAAKQEALMALVGAIDAAAVSDPATSGTVISLLKGLLAQLQAGSPVS
ncbi:MAG TPA: hypothetical protein GXX72_01325, partial [Clostridiaceae bacterium]|nr:hypothetical protein [Clostridiaceae bacterium]